MPAQLRRCVAQILGRIRRQVFKFCGDDVGEPGCFGVISFRDGDQRFLPIEAEGEVDFGIEGERGEAGE